MDSDKHHVYIEAICNIINDGKPEGVGAVFLYAFVDYGFVAPSVYDEHESRIIYRSSNVGAICEVLLSLWGLDEFKEKWHEFECVIKNGKFDITYRYAHEIDQSQDFSDRREQAVRRYFGEKEIVYPDEAEFHQPGDFEMH